MLKIQGYQIKLGLCGWSSFRPRIIYENFCIFIPFKDCDLEAALIEKEALEKGWRQTEINSALCWVDRNGKIVEKKKFSSKHTEHVDSLDFDDENSEMKSTIAQSTMQFFSG